MKLFLENVPFYKGNLHTHTTCSDGMKTPQEVMAIYQAMGYDFLALTDHRRVTKVEEVPEGLVMIPGIELDYTLPTQVVHLVGVGVVGEMREKFHLTTKPQEGIDLIRDCGGLAILCHPAWSLNTSETMAGFHGLTAAEVWNSVSTLPYNAIRADSSALLDVASTLGAVLPLVANDDTHFYGAELGRGWNMVQAEEKSVDGIMKALAAGRFYATQGPEIHQIEITGNKIRVSCSPAETVCFFSNQPWVDERSFMGHDLTSASYTIQPGDTFVRCQIVDSQGKNAWSSPIRTQK